MAVKPAAYHKCIRRSIAYYACSAASFLLIPISDFRGEGLERILAYLVGVLFWLGLLLGLVLTHRLSRIRKAAQYKAYQRPGLLCFFRNRRAVVGDIALLVSLLCLIVLQKLLGASHTASVALLSVTCFNVYLHAVFNGNNYAYAVQRV